MAGKKNLVKNGEVVEITVQASVDEARVHPGDDPIADEIAVLESMAAEDPQMQAAAAVEAYILTPGAASLLERSIDSLAKADGKSITDPDFKFAVQSRAALLNATGGDLPMAIACLVEAMGEDPKAIAGSVYNVCYAVIKQASFFANLDYRRYLDPRADFDLIAYREADVGEDYNGPATREALGTDFAVDQREEFREPPVGLDSMLEREWNYFSEVYGGTVDTTEDIFAASLSDLRTYLQLMTEAFGWSADGPMPYANIMHPDGTFEPITDAVAALDHQEITGKERRKRQQQSRGEAMLAASKLVAAKLLAARPAKTAK